VTLRVVILVLLLLLVWGCTSREQRFRLAPRSAPAPVGALDVPLGLDAFASVPEENPLTAEKSALGRRLFADPILSLDRTHSCASCHRPGHAFADSARISPGVRGRRTARNAPTLVNRAYGKAFFWDGRAASLERAVLQPIENPDELALGLPALIPRLRFDARYRVLFQRAFPAEQITPTTVSYALASYLRTVRVGDTPVDRYVSGDTTALSQSARRGRTLFLGKGGCADCHSGPTFTDERFHNTGVAVGRRDTGRYTVTRDVADLGRFKTPTLRRIASTAPYMHDGSIPTLDQVVEFYDGGGRTSPNLDPDIRPLHLSAVEKADLLAFLRALGGGAME
jgi:cytochrome c peroxidase